MKTKKAIASAMKTNSTNLMEILHPKMILIIQIATLMLMNFLKEEQFQKIQWNNCFQFHKASISKIQRDKGSTVGHLEISINPNMKSKAIMMRTVTVMKPHSLLIQSHQNILRTMIEFTFSRGNMDQVDHSRAKDTFYLLWYSEQCAAHLTLPIPQISNQLRILSSKIYSSFILICN